MAILFHIDPGNGKVWITERERLAQASVLLRNKLENVADGGTVHLEAHEPATNAAAIMYVLEYLQDGFADPHGLDYDAKSLAEICNFLDECECDTSPFQGLLDRINQQSSLDHPSQRRCWRRIIPRKETATAGQLAISALVLEKEQTLERALSVVVWALDTKLDTTVPELVEEKLQKMREEERKDIYVGLKNQLFKLLQSDQRMNKLGREIIERVKSHNLGDFNNEWEENCKANSELQKYNPYRLIRRFEDAIRPPETKSPATGSRAPDKHSEPTGPRAVPINMGELRQAVGSGINHLVKRKSMVDSSLAIIDGIFDVVEARVKLRQENRAKDLIKDRKETRVPGSTRQPSPRAQGHQRGGSDQSSVQQCRPLPRVTNTNGYSSSDDHGEGSSGHNEGAQAQEAEQRLVYGNGTWPGAGAESSGGGSKRRGLDPPPPAELSSEMAGPSRRGPRVDSTPPSPRSKGKQKMAAQSWLRELVDRGEGSASWHGNQNGLDGVFGLGEFKPHFDHREESWRLGGP